MRYRLRTLLILVAVLPPLLWTAVNAVVSCRAWLGRRYVQNALRQQVDLGAYPVDDLMIPPDSVLAPQSNLAATDE
jgi:sensor domain CHASE-containing protein